MLRANAIAGAIALGVCYAIGSGTALAAEGGCAQPGAMTDSTTLERASGSVLCLVNSERGRYGLAPLRASRVLGRAAERHSRDMVTRQYFSHVSPNGANVRERARRAGYVRKRRSGKVGETIAWGTDRLATPAELVRSFMNSDGHRRTLLDDRYRDIGVGLVLGAPVFGMAEGATLTLDFGRR